MPTTDPSVEGAEEALVVLLAEDSVVQAQALRLSLEGRGFIVRVTGNGVEALEQARQEAPAVVVSDIEMPEMDGFELCRALKEDVHLRTILVILMTSHSDPEDIFRGLEVKADNYLTKPCEEDVLVDRIEHLLANRDLRSRPRSSRGVEVVYARRRHKLDNDREQILELLMSSLDNAMRRHAGLEKRVQDLEKERRELLDEVTRLRGTEA
jgi:two-component system cell cycle response regulator